MKCIKCNIEKDIADFKIIQKSYPFYAAIRSNICVDCSDPEIEDEYTGKINPWNHIDYQVKTRQGIHHVVRYFEDKLDIKPRKTYQHFNPYDNL
jgi:hypothetical protein